MTTAQYQVLFPWQFHWQHQTKLLLLLSFVPIKCANVPPICPAPIKDILVIFSSYFIVGITNSAFERIPEGHLDVTVFNFV